MKRIFALLLVLLVLFISVGCAFKTAENEEEFNTTENENLNEDQNSLDTNEQKEAFILTDFYGFTVKDVTDRWGEDYIISQGLIAGGWRAIFYQDNRCPFVFCYATFDTEATRCNPSEKIAGVFVYPDETYDNLYIINNIKVTSTYSEIYKEIPGTLFEDAINDGMSYSCDITEHCSLNINWQNSLEEIPSEICISFR